MLGTMGVALKAVRHGWFTNGFSAVALAAVLAPLLVLYGLKLGIVTGLLDELRQDPGIRRIGVSGYKPMTEDDIAAIRTMPGTGFVVGSPRSIAARVEMRKGHDALDVVTADWLPTGAGDPLLVEGAPTPGDDQIILSEPLAEKLKVKPGDVVTAAVYRNNQTETYERDLTVSSILPRRLLAGERALVTANRLNGISAFSDGYAIAEAGIGGRPLSQRVALYDSVRLYARSIDDVVSLERAVAQAYGFRTSSEAASIEWVRELERIMTGVFAIVSVAGGLGYVISLWATIAGSVRASRSHLGLLRLLGLRQRALWVFPFVQVIVITTCGLCFAFGLATVSGMIMNRLYLPDMFNGRIFLLRPRDVVLTVALSYAVAAAVAFWQLAALSKISPTEALAENLAG